MEQAGQGDTQKTLSSLLPFFIFLFFFRVSRGVEMHIQEDAVLKELREEMDKRIRFLEGRISHLEDCITRLEERLRRRGSRGGRGQV